MRSLFILLIIFLSTSLNAQWLGIINDPDGYTNVRKEPSIKSDVIGKIYDNEIFHIGDIDYDTIPDWRSVFRWPENGEPIGGWMHKSRVQYLDLLGGLTNWKMTADRKKIYLTHDSIYFELEIQQFDTSKHKYTYHKEYGHITKIDGSTPKGVDGGIPRTEVKNIVMKISDTEIKIPADQYTDLYEFYFPSFRAYYKNDGTIFIRSYNSDGAGHYMLVWKFKNKKYQGRFIGYL